MSPSCSRLICFRSSGAFASVDCGVAHARKPPERTPIKSAAEAMSLRGANCRRAKRRDRALSEQLPRQSRRFATTLSFESGMAKTSTCLSVVRGERRNTRWRSDGLRHFQYQRFQFIYERTVPPSPFHFFPHDREGFLRLQRLAIRPVGRQSVVNIRDLQHSRQERNLVALEPVGIP